MATKFGGKNPWPECNTLLGSKGHAGVKLLSNALWPPNLVEKTLNQSVLHWWGQRSFRGHPGSTRGQFAKQCPMATKFGRIPEQSVTHCWVEGHAGVKRVQPEGNCLEMHKATKCSQCCLKALCSYRCSTGCIKKKWTVWNMTLNYKIWKYWSKFSFT